MSVAAASAVRRVCGLLVKIIKFITLPVGLIFGKLLAVKSLRHLWESLHQITFRTLSAQVVSLLLIVCIFTTSTPAAAPTLLYISANELRQDVRYSLLANFSDATLAANLSSFSLLDWVGAMNPILGVITGTGIFKKKGKQDQKPEPPQRIVILPSNETNTLTVLQGEKINLTAIGLGAKEQPIGGLQFNWTVVDKTRNLPARPLAGGSFEARIPGTFLITAESHGKQAQINIAVNPNEGMGMQRLLQKAQAGEANLSEVEKGVLNNLAQKGLLTRRESSTKGRHNPEEEAALSRAAKQKIQDVKAKQAERVRQMQDPSRQKPPPNQPNQPRGPKIDEEQEAAQALAAEQSQTAPEAVESSAESVADSVSEKSEKNETEREAPKELLPGDQEIPKNKQNFKNSINAYVSGTRILAKTTSAIKRRPADEDFWDGGNHWLATEPFNAIGSTPGAAPSAGASNGNFSCRSHDLI